MTIRQIARLLAAALPAVLLAAAAADQVALYTETRWCDPATGQWQGWAGVYDDSNWDLWQQDQGPLVVEEALYLCAYDGAVEHRDYQPDAPLNGVIDGAYSSYVMDEGGAATTQSLLVMGTDPNEFPYNQRDTRVMALFNLRNVRAVNAAAGAVLDARFRFSIYRVFAMSGATTELYSPSALHVSIYPARKQEYYRSPPDPYDPNRSNNPLADLQDLFDGNPETEKTVSLLVDDGPWGPGPQPLTNWYIVRNGTQFYEVDFTAELRRLLADEAALEWVGVTIRAALDGEVVSLSMDAQDNLNTAYPWGIPPTLDVQVSRYRGDLNDDGRVDLADWALFCAAWGAIGADQAADLNGDGVVDEADLILFAQNWLTGAPPPGLATSR